MLDAVKTAKSYKTFSDFKEHPALPGDTNSRERAVNDRLGIVRAGAVTRSQVVQCIVQRIVQRIAAQW